MISLAYALRETGMRTLLLERGDFLPQEPQNWIPSAVFKDNRYGRKRYGMTLTEIRFILESITTSTEAAADQDSWLAESAVSVARIGKMEYEKSMG